eukprot:TRINITY_DN2756_c0_g1_i2.p1 TRINITY_DN2756_c0_g1~~TRINITY_DN2756_c0_g1_i2.p1  ORF type:complete len:199 (+),score=51.71 TRINITY_DN2756_c0_g1_i2:654-1250(+)
MTLRNSFTSPALSSMTASPFAVPSSSESPPSTPTIHRTRGGSPPATPSPVQIMPVTIPASPMPVAWSATSPVRPSPTKALMPRPASPLASPLITPLLPPTFSPAQPRMAASLMMGSHTPMDTCSFLPYEHWRQLFLKNVERHLQHLAQVQSLSPQSPHAQQLSPQSQQSPQQNLSPLQQPQTSPADSLRCWRALVEQQ